MTGIKYYIPGATLILSGLLIVIFPEILIALFASIIIMAGIGALYIGKRLGESERGFKNTYRSGFNDDFVENYRTVNKPYFRHYRRWF